MRHLHGVQHTPGKLCTPAAPLQEALQRQLPRRRGRDARPLPALRLGRFAHGSVSRISQTSPRIPSHGRAPPAHGLCGRKAAAAARQPGTRVADGRCCRPPRPRAKAWLYGRDTERSHRPIWGIASTTEPSPAGLWRRPGAPERPVAVTAAAWLGLVAGRGCPAAARVVRGGPLQAAAAGLLARVDQHAVHLLLGRRIPLQQQPAQGLLPTRDVPLLLRGAVLLR